MIPPNLLLNVSGLQAVHGKETKVPAMTIVKVQWSMQWLCAGMPYFTFVVARLPRMYLDGSRLAFEGIPWHCTENRGMQLDGLSDLGNRPQEVKWTEHCMTSALCSCTMPAFLKQFFGMPLSMPHCMCFSCPTLNMNSTWQGPKTSWACFQH